MSDHLNKNTIKNILNLEINAQYSNPGDSNSESGQFDELIHFFEFQIDRKLPKNYSNFLKELLRRSITENKEISPNFYKLIDDEIQSIEIKDETWESLSLLSNQLKQQREKTPRSETSLRGNLSNSSLFVLPEIVHQPVQVHQTTFDQLQQFDTVVPSSLNTSSLSERSFFPLSSSSFSSSISNNVNEIPKVTINPFFDFLKIIENYTDLENN